MKFYHGTTTENWTKINEEGILFGFRNTDGCNSSRCTYLALDINEAKSYGEILLEVEYDPFLNKKDNNYCDGCWQLRVYEPISINKITKL